MLPCFSFGALIRLNSGTDPTQSCRSAVTENQPHCSDKPSSDAHGKEPVVTLCLVFSLPQLPVPVTEDQQRNQLTSTTEPPGSALEPVEVRTENLFQRTEVLAGWCFLRCWWIRLEQKDSLVTNWSWEPQRNQNCRKTKNILHFKKQLLCL